MYDEIFSLMAVRKHTGGQMLDTVSVVQETSPWYHIPHYSGGCLDLSELQKTGWEDK